MKKALVLMVFLSFFMGINTVFPARDNDTRVDVLYFHATTRCHGCLAIEENARKSVLTLFEKQLKDSSITFTSIDFMLDQNAHYQDDYKFDAQTLIISKKVDGKEVKWKNLDKIWDYSGDYKKFQKYIEDEIKSLLKAS